MNAEFRLPVNKKLLTFGNFKRDYFKHIHYLNEIPKLKSEPYQRRYNVLYGT